MDGKHILTWVDGKGLRIYGPFEDTTSLAAFGRAWQAKHDDNPCWQRILLPTSQFNPALNQVHVPVVNPKEYFL